MHSVFKSFFVVLSQLSVAGVASAESFGPYFYRTGDSESYARFETTIEQDKTSVIVHECGEHMHGLISQSERQCWTENLKPDEFELNAKSLVISGTDVMKVDFGTGRLSLFDRHDNHVIVRDVEAGVVAWELTPASWNFRGR
jgi:hypothetical protein